MTGKVAGTFAIPTVTPCLDRIDQSGSTFSMLVLAVCPPTTKPVMPFSSGGTLVAKVVNTLGQLGAEVVLSFPKVPLSRIRFRFGISPWISNGRRMSHSAPFTEKTTTRGLADFFSGAVDVVCALQTVANKVRRIPRRNKRHFGMYWLRAGS